MNKIKVSLLTILAASSLSWANDSITFGTQGTTSEVQPNGNNSADLGMNEDALTIVGDNFWTIQAKVANVGLHLSEASDKDFLEIEISGSIQDKGPSLRVLLTNKDWSKRYEYRFDLSEIDSATAKTIRATTPLSQPVAELGTEDEPIAPEAGTVIDNVLFITMAEEGNKPWQLDIKSLNVVEAK